MQQAPRHVARLPAPHAATLSRPAPGRPAPRRKPWLPLDDSMQLDFAEMQLAEDLRLLEEQDEAAVAQEEEHDDALSAAQEADGPVENAHDSGFAEGHAVRLPSQAEQAGLAQRLRQRGSEWAALPPPGIGTPHAGQYWAHPAAVSRALGVQYKSAGAVSPLPCSTLPLHSIAGPAARITDSVAAVPSEQLQQLPGKLRDHLLKVDALRSGRVTPKAFCQALLPLCRLDAPRLEDDVLHQHIVPRLTVAMHAVPRTAGAWSCAASLAEALRKHPRVVNALRAHPPACAAAAALLDAAARDANVAVACDRWGAIADIMRKLAIDCPALWAVVAVPPAGGAAASRAPFLAMCAACEVTSAREHVAASPQLQQRLASAAAVAVPCLRMHEFKQLAANVAHHAHWAAPALHQPLAERMAELQQVQKSRVARQPSTTQADGPQQDLLKMGSVAGTAPAGQLCDSAEALLAQVQRLSRQHGAHRAGLRDAAALDALASPARCQLVLAWASAWHRGNTGVDSEPHQQGQGSADSVWVAHKQALASEAAAQDAWSAAPPARLQDCARQRDSAQAVDREQADRLLGAPQRRAGKHARRRRQQGLQLKERPQMRATRLPQSTGMSAKV